MNVVDPTLTTTATDTAKLAADRSAEYFAERLRYFVNRWKPENDSRDVYDFQMDLTNLMVDAMRHKSDCMSLGITHYADMQFAQMALHPLHVITERPKR